MSNIANLNKNILEINKNPILADAGFDTNNNRNAIPSDTGTNFNNNEIEQEIPERSISINKVSFRDFDFIIDLKGDGTHQSLYDALNEAKRVGGGSIYLKNGEYLLSDDIVLESNIYLIGEDKRNTIINLSGDNAIKVLGDNAYRTGTISVANGDATITGAGTLWLSNLAVGDYIVFSGNYYKVLTVTDDTHIEITSNYLGNPGSGLSYFAGTFATNIIMENFTVKGQDVSAASDAMYLQGCLGITVKNLLFKDNDATYTTSLKLAFVFNSLFSDLEIINSGLDGLDIVASDYNQFSDINCNGNNQNGILLYGASHNMFNNINSNDNNYAGVSILDYT
jgi:hypothetical protein